MILKESFSEEHIRDLQKSSKRDPILLERTVYAFGLLEALARVGMPFIFKGGTSLMLLLGTPKRLSTDIDIIVKPGTDVTEYLERASKIFPFEKYEEQVRIGKNNIEKRHFKFIYSSPISENILYILLDILFEENHYEKLVEKEIRNSLLIVSPEYITVNVPSLSCILGDKLTAFAPHTTGILLGTGKDMEIMKQFYDISTLLDEFDNFQDVKNTYFKVVESEIAYRGIDKDARDCLSDTLDTALCIASRGKVGEVDYPFYVKAIRELRTHIYSENYSPEIAVGNAAKIVYMAVCLLTDNEYKRLLDYREYMGKRILHEEFLPLKYLKKANPEAYAYIIKADELWAK